MRKRAAAGGCYRVGHKTRGLGLEGQRERRSSEVSLIAPLARVNNLLLFAVPLVVPSSSLVPYQFSSSVVTQSVMLIFLMRLLEGRLGKEVVLLVVYILYFNREIITKL